MEVRAVRIIPPFLVAYDALDLYTTGKCAIDELTLLKRSTCHVACLDGRNVMDYRCPGRPENTFGPTEFDGPQVHPQATFHPAILGQLTILKGSLKATGGPSCQSADQKWPKYRNSSHRQRLSRAAGPAASCGRHASKLARDANARRKCRACSLTLSRRTKQNQSAPLQIKMELQQTRPVLGAGKVGWPSRSDLPLLIFFCSLPLCRISRASSVGQKET